MEELTEQQKLAKARIESMQSLAQGIAVDFEPILYKIKELVQRNASKEEIFYEVDRLLGIIAQLKTISGLNKRENDN